MPDARRTCSRSGSRRPTVPDSVALLEKQSATREHALVPVRYARMMVSPFTFYCGGAQIMANDLAATPTAGLMTQLCGDAHILNFGVYIAPEGHRVFDFSEFDETLPGPFEYDVKRLATSVTVAARHTGMSSDQCRTVTSTMVHAYRTAIARSARMGLLELWYSRIPDNEIAAAWDTLAGQSGVGTRRRECPEIVDRNSDGPRRVADPRRTPNPRPGQPTDRRRIRGTRRRTDPISADHRPPVPPATGPRAKYRPEKR